MMLHLCELAATSWLAFYAANVFGGDIWFQLTAWAVFFAIVAGVNALTAD